MKFRVLGPLEVFDTTRWVSVGTAKSRALLATLLIDVGHIVPTDQIAHELWGDVPPKTVANQVHGQIARLRRAIGDVDGRMLVTRAPGYQLLLEPSMIDAHRFTDAVAAGREALVSGDARTASVRLHEALAWWRGPAFADVPATAAVQSAAARLEEQRLAALELRIEADLACGRYALLAGELQVLTERHPFREGLWRLRMLALYRSGRRADALTVFRDTRARFVDELGVEPGAELQSLHQRMLAADPELADVAAGTDPGHAAAVVAPAQLPPPPVLRGRDRVTAEVTATLTETGRMPVCVVHGMAGVGKTALALSVAHRLRPRFPDGQLWIDLRSADTRPVLPLDALGRFLRALGVPSASLPEDVDERSALYRSVMADRRMLVVLDNAVSETQVRPLLPGTPGSAVMMTAREWLSGLTDASSVHLDVLTPDAAIQLIAEGAEHPPGVAAEVADLCGYLPLALRVVAAKASGYPPRTLSELRDRLYDQRRRLDELSVPAMSVRTSLAVSWAELSEPDRRVLGVMAALDVSSFSAAAVGGLISGDPPAEAEATDRLDSLTGRHWLEAAGTGADGRRRYTLHDLVRLFVRRTEPAGDAVVADMLADWVRRARSAAAALPIRRLGVHVGREDDPTALPWFDAERHVLPGLVEQAVRLGRDADAVALAEYASAYCELRSAFTEWDAMVVALEPVIARAEPVLRIRALCLAAAADYSADRLELAEHRSRTAHDLAVAHGDTAGLAHSLSVQTYVAGFQGRIDLAYDLAGRSLERFEEVGDEHCAAFSRQALANTMARQPKYAEDACAQARIAAEWFVVNGDLIGQAGCCMALHHGLRELGDHRGSLEAAQRMQTLCRRAGDDRGVAVGQRLAGGAYLELGRLADAYRALTAALETNRRMKSESGVARSLVELSEAAARLGRNGEAQALLTEAAHAWRRLGREDLRTRALEQVAAFGSAVAAVGDEGGGEGLGVGWDAPRRLTNHRPAERASA
ncbi:AfsR/SARP family transcriptional regulator [Phytomonospora endophytica]|uniref:DNA-binding SARP family transcriptional activator/tetratricopeptide (TPR) repeat protein n=1 Tax=Phytomonospora endophytica TaxID=714109 RepID=A0A841FD30_9ACTN|nr:AfsR/SARP family transcriptional regulator [Phytomonospora endophytica]MBB6032913.1 DNA-binding SARP family transcriptional activator/tetratricopeptide (TPR) repeat protein [Phytomonospora endophytica]GIG65139.1 SARP family transcriptional regulator [Phytomonospora endophytica]